MIELIFSNRKFNVITRITERRAKCIPGETFQSFGSTDTIDVLRASLIMVINTAVNYFINPLLR